MKKALFALTSLVLMFACTPAEEDNTTDLNEEEATYFVQSVTEEADHISAVSAVLNGNAVLNGKDGIIEYGFVYSKSATDLVDSPILIKSDNIDTDLNFSLSISGLKPETVYYFRSYLFYKDGVIYYGETKSFTTKGVSTLLMTQEATEVEATSANINAMLDLTDVQCYTMAYGFYWGESENDQSSKFSCSSIVDNAYSTTLANLSHKTQYWYKAYVKLDDQTFFGELKSFTTGEVKVENVSLDRSEYTFNSIGNTLYLHPTVLPADATDKSVEWSSSDNNVATVSSSGLVKAVGNGTATITVTTKDQSKTATCAITVGQLITGLSLDKTSLTLNEGEEYTLTANVKPDNAADKTIEWTSSNMDVAVVDANGKVTAISKGTATIKATAQDGSGKYASCEVAVIRLVSSIELDKTSVVLIVGNTETITATVSPADANNTGITWTSSNKSIAEVSSSGVITGKQPGTVTITAKANDASGKYASCEVKVREYYYVTDLFLTKTSLDLTIGDMETLEATISPSNADNKDLAWSTDNQSVATVNNGVVTALAKGKATITVSATDGSGITDTCSVVVSNPCPAGAVDLGFRTSDGYRLYWATSNLSTSGLCANPQDYGDYYAWGETEPYYEEGHSQDNPCSSWRTRVWRPITGYNWVSYRHCDGSWTHLTKYINNKYTFKDYNYVDDAARQTLGGMWRTPTRDEWKELLENSTCKWTNNYNGTGVAGMIVTCWYTYKSIFFPAAGYRYKTGLEAIYAGSFYEGCYWSDRSPTEMAYYVLFGIATDLQINEIKYTNRCAGQSVRPVSE